MIMIEKTRNPIARFAEDIVLNVDKKNIEQYLFK